MKKKYNTTEELLQSGESLSLSASERREIKASLLSYANYHTPITTPLVPQRFSFWSRVAATSLGVFLVMVGTGVAASSSLPGDVLYPVKVDVVEEISAQFQFSPAADLEFGRERFERRLGEVLALEEDEALTKDALADVQVQLEELVSEISLIAAEQVDANPLGAMEAISDARTVSAVIADIAADTALADAADPFELIADSVNLIHESSLNALLTSSTSSVEAFIAAQIEEIDNEFSESDISTSTLGVVEEFVSDTELAIQNGDYSLAVRLVSEAVLTLEAEDYRSEFESETIE